MRSIRKAPIGIVGGGFGALITYITLRFRGLAVKDILVFSPDSSPEKSWEGFARAINLTSLRSESNGHFYPTDSPGLATVQSIKTLSLKPIIQSWFDRYHPTVDFFLEHTRRLAHQTGFYRSLVASKVTHIERLKDQFAIYGQAGTPLAFVKDVMLAVGHGREQLPEAVENFRKLHPEDSRVVSSFQPKTYRPRAALVIGDGITAATEWANVLQVGGAVAAVSRSGFNLNQPLQVPRRYFSRRGIKSYRKKSAEDRMAELKAATRGTVPKNPAWKKLFRQAQADNRLGLVKGFVKNIEINPDGRLACEVEFTDQHITHTIVVDQVISAAGFLPPSTNPLIAHLIEQYGLPTVDGILQLDEQCCLDKLSSPNSIFAVIGSAAAWAIPCCDSVAGMKISARAFAEHILGPESLSPHQLWQQTLRWSKIIFGKELT